MLQPLTAEELARIKAEKRQRDHAKKQKISENRYVVCTTVEMGYYDIVWELMDCQ